MQNTCARTHTLWHLIKMWSVNFQFPLVYDRLYRCKSVFLVHGIMVIYSSCHICRYRGRRSRTRSPSASRSPIRYRKRRYSRSPVRSRSPVEPSRYRVSPRPEKRRSPSRSRSPSASRSSLDSQSPKKASKDESRSSSESPSGKKGLVSYGDGSPDSGQR